MKYRISYLFIFMAASLLSLFSCSDEYMEELNTDPSKAAEIDPNAQLTTAQLQTYGDLGMVEIYRNYIYGFTQQLMGCWNTTNYGGRHTIADSEMSRIWTSFYTNSIKNLTDAIYRTADDEAQTNIHSVLTIYRAYMMSIITDIYGDAPCSEAGKGYLESIFNPVYDTQEKIYDSFFTDLASAETALDPSKDAVTGDLIYGGDIAKWKKLANSLRLRYAMRISGVAPEKARTEFEAALSSEGGIMESSADEALIQYMDIAFSFGQDSYSDYRGNALSKLLFGNDPANNPSYICSTLFDEMYDNDDPRTFMLTRCYYDGLMSATSPDNRVDLTQEMIEKGIEFKPCEPGAFSYDPWPEGYDSDILAGMAETNPAVTITVARETMPKLENNFLQSENPGVVMTFAEVKFLLSEAVLNGWNVPGGDAESLYKEGVRAAIDFLTERYGCESVSDEDFDAYIAAGGSFGHGKAAQREAINTQAWILHFTNPAECWANQRRSGCPALKSPAEYGFGQYLSGGQEIPVRLCYPVLESSYNKTNYDDALSRMGGNDSWYNHVWWDIN